jgi:hypothetical protein
MRLKKKNKLKHYFYFFFDINMTSSQPKKPSRAERRKKSLKQDKAELRQLRFQREAYEALPEDQRQKLDYIRERLTIIERLFMEGRVTNLWIETVPELKRSPPVDLIQKPAKLNGAGAVISELPLEEKLQEVMEEKLPQHMRRGLARSSRKLYTCEEGTFQEAIFHLEEEAIQEVKTRQRYYQQVPE